MNFPTSPFLGTVLGLMRGLLCSFLVHTVGGVYLRFAKCVAPRFNGISLIGLMGVGDSPSSGAQGSIAFSHRHKAYSNSGLKPACIKLANILINLQRQSLKKKKTNKILPVVY
jgi:hypothetical protein